MSFALSSKQTKVHYESMGQGPTLLLFIHGWLGHSQWWNAQRDFFAGSTTVVQMDLPGHGRSEPLRQGYSAEKYAQAIARVAENVTAEAIILVGHSMAGAYALEASLLLPKARAVVLVDTLKDLDELMSPQQAEEGLFRLYRKDFKSAVETVLPQFLFSKSTPEPVRTRLQREFLMCDGNLACQLLEPLYRMDIRSVARRVAIPVRAINSDSAPTSCENNRKYLRDYDFVSISGTGHYPMLERPDEFNRNLDEVIKEFMNP